MVAMNKDPIKQMYGQLDRISGRGPQQTAVVKEEDPIPKSSERQAGYYKI
jgi:hypothetical protein